MSVFERHKADIELYEATAPSGNLPARETGRLLFAMAILSDVQEMVPHPSVVEELNEAKELIASVIGGGR